MLLYIYLLTIHSYLFTSTMHWYTIRSTKKTATLLSCNSFISTNYLSFLSISPIAAILPSEDNVSFGRISLLAGLLAISLRASTCFNAITVSFVPDSIIAVFTFFIAYASAFATASIASALPCASKSWQICAQTKFMLSSTKA